MVELAKETRNIKLTIAYDGTAYHGFQRQANATTVQQVLEDNLATIFGHPVKLTGAARTDAGVHAYGQVANLYTTGRIPVERIYKAARGALPPDIVIRAAVAVPGDFHARFWAKSKIYIYRLYYDAVADPFQRNYAWHLADAPAVDRMQAAMAHLVGEHDFSAFRATGGPPVDPVRRILEATCRQDKNWIEFTFWGTGFLYHMVRNMVGTLVDVGLGRLTPVEFAAILAGRDRKCAGITAPPQGLYLKEVFY